MNVMRNLPNLEYLDDKKITDDLRHIAKVYASSHFNYTNTDFRKAHPKIANMQTIQTKT